MFRPQSRNEYHYMGFLNKQERLYYFLGSSEREWTLGMSQFCFDFTLFWIPPYSALIMLNAMGHPFCPKFCWQNWDRSNMYMCDCELASWTVGPTNIPHPWMVTWFIINSCRAVGLHSLSVLITLHKDIWLSC